MVKLHNNEGPNVDISWYFRCYNISSLAPKGPRSSVDSLLYLPFECLRPEIASSVSLPDITGCCWPRCLVGQARVWGRELVLAASAVTPKYGCVRQKHLES